MVAESSRPTPDPTELIDRAIEKLRVHILQYVDSLFEASNERLHTFDEVADERFESVKQQFTDRDNRSSRELQDTKERFDRRSVDIEVAAQALASRVRETSDFHAAAHAREHAAHEREHVLTEAALVKADLSLDKRLDSMNGFRAQLGDQSKTLVSKEVLEGHRADVIQRIERNSSEIDVLRAQNERLQGILSVARFLGVGGIAIAVVALVTAFTGN